ncbi:unnamed protein product [Rhizophagus irregularis]|nr:unnamed protein product [Rhizophagus irregularis]CAB4403594.1 unnamed protein product [Rhizophagus irregularis]
MPQVQPQPKDNNYGNYGLDGGIGINMEELFSILKMKLYLDTGGGINMEELFPILKLIIFSIAYCHLYRAEILRFDENFIFIDLIHQCIYLGHDEELSIKEDFSCLKLVLLKQTLEIHRKNNCLKSTYLRIAPIVIIRSVYQNAVSTILFSKMYV